MRVIICEDHALVRDGLERLLVGPRFEIAARSTPTPRRSSPRSRPRRPDVCVLDVRLPPRFTDEGVRAAIEARRQLPGLPILILSQYVEQTFARELLAAARAASATCSRTVWPTRGSLSRRCGAWPTAAPRLTRRRSPQLLGAGDDEGRLELLTPREREVLSLMAEGRSNGGIAAGARGHRAGRREARFQHLLEARPARDGKDHRRVLAVLAWLQGQ